MIKQIISYIKEAKPKDKQLIYPTKCFRDKGLNIYSIQFIFLVIALLYASVLFFQKGTQVGDITFHLLRLKDVELELIHGQLPQFNFYTNMPLGSALNTFYPYILLLPFSLLFLFCKGTTVLAIIMFSIVLIALEVCYYCFNHVLQFSHFSAFLIATFQWVASTTFSTAIIGFDYGTITGSIFYPVVFVGWIKWITNNKWRMMAIGICGATLSNLPTAMIMILVLILFTILQWKRLTIYKIIIGIKASLISIFILSVYWFPMIVLKFTNHIYFPNQINIKEDNDTFLPNSLVSALTPMGYKFWDLLEFLAIILVIIYWKHLQTFIKQMAGVAIFLMFTDVRTLGIKNFFEMYPPIKWIQFTQRLNLITHFLLIICLIICMNILITQVKHKQLIVNIWYPIIIIYTCLLSLIGFVVCKDTQSKQPFGKDINEITVKDASENLAVANNRYNEIYIDMDSTTLHTINTSIQYPDYLPYSVLDNRVRNQMPYKVNHYYDNGMNFKEKHNNQRVLPFTLYNAQRYKIMDNNHPLQYKCYHHFIKANLHKGQNKIRITAPVMWYRYIGLLGSIVGICALCHKSKRRKK